MGAKNGNFFGNFWKIIGYKLDIVLDEVIESITSSNNLSIKNKSRPEKSVNQINAFFGLSKIQIGSKISKLLSGEINVNIR